MTPLQERALRESIPPDVLEIIGDVDDLISADEFFGFDPHRPATPGDADAELITPGKLDEPTVPGMPQPPAT